MQYFLIGLAALVLTLYLLRAFLNADPRKLSGRMRKFGGIAALVLAGVMALRGGIIIAVPLAMLGMGLLGWTLPGGFTPLGGGGAGGPRSAGQRSRVRTRFLDMLLDHDTGGMDGEVTAGRFAGRRLSSMVLAELSEFWSECRQQDTQSARLLEAYLDRVAPDWREAAGAGPAGADAGGPARGGTGPMTVEEAYEVLGLRPGADADDIRRAHRELMKKLHPDMGGSTYLAAKINEAKDLLLRGRR